MSLCTTYMFTCPVLLCTWNAGATSCRMSHRSLHDDTSVHGRTMVTDEACNTTNFTLHSYCYVQWHRLFSMGVVLVWLWLNIEGYTGDRNSHCDSFDSSNHLAQGIWQQNNGQKLQSSHVICVFGPQMRQNTLYYGIISSKTAFWRKEQKWQFTIIEHGSDTGANYKGRQFYLTVYLIMMNFKCKTVF